MRLTSLALTNIRSYTAATVAFPEGLTLLAGDIGAGKSSLLLALEFALFGVQRGEVSGSSLLRHGCQKGEVVLDAEIAGKNVRLTRRLKRTSSGVAQEAGSIAVDGITTECTAQELKARVLELLAYPASVVATGKRNPFRYTVYTPQEQMKAILEESAEERLDTLRRLFGIDTYKRVAENAAILVRDLKKEEAALAAAIETLRQGLPDRKAVEERLRKAKDELAAAQKRAAAAQEALTRLTAQADAAEKERFARSELQKRHAVLRGQARERQRRAEELAAERTRLATLAQETEKQLAPADDEALRKEAALLAERERKIAEKERQALKQEAALDAKAARSQEIARAIAALDTCPTCKQDVDERHKRRIRAAEEKVASDCAAKLKALAEVKAKLQEHRAAMERKKAEHAQRERLVEANKVKRDNLVQLRGRVAALDDALAKAAKERERLAAETAKLVRELAKTKETDEEAFQELRRRAEAQRTEATALAVRAAELAKDETRAEEELKRQKEQQARIAEREKERTALQRRLAWLAKHLVPVCGAIEKRLFHSVHGAFNEYFREWFSILIEDETLVVRLDGSFAPVIAQDGYEAELGHLSGGERTSVALAYRLSLNKAVNEFLSALRTRDLLILDEPTDGFSSEQLDRVRAVLARLGLKQVIVVSHEEQLEGYADHVLRVTKEAHESRVSA